MGEIPLPCTGVGLERRSGCTLLTAAGGILVPKTPVWTKATVNSLVQNKIDFVSVGRLDVKYLLL